jgi:5-bromo-4-chloroindolyl phosphate hydrolysis protein
MARQLASGFNWLAGCVAAALLLPLLSLVVQLPFWLAFAAALLACGGLGLLLAPRDRYGRLSASRIGRAKIDFAAELLADAKPLVARIEVASRAIRTVNVKYRVHHLADVARGILSGVEQDPLKIDRVRRFVTYYLPRAAEMAEAYGLLEKQAAPRPGRLAATCELIDRLDGAFTRYADNLVDADLDNLDIELKLLKASLDEDLGSPPPGPIASASPQRSK